MNGKETRKTKWETECGGWFLPRTPPPLSEMLGSLLVVGNIADSKEQAFAKSERVYLVFPSCIRFIYSCIHLFIQRSWKVYCADALPFSLHI